MAATKATKKKTVKKTPRKSAAKKSTKKKAEVVEEEVQEEPQKKSKKQTTKKALARKTKKTKKSTKAATAKTEKPGHKKSPAKVIVAVVLVFLVLVAVASIEFLTKSSEEETEPVVEEITEEPMPTKNVRPPSVAGVFYPEGKSILEEQIQSLLWNTKNEIENRDVMAIIAPHAAYRYSGSVDASAYKTVMNKDFDRVIIMASAHQTEFEGVALSEYDAWRTPLGETDIDEANVDLVDNELFFYKDAAFVDEHPIEIHLPFVQHIWSEATFIPILIGQIEDDDRITIANALKEIMDEKTLLVISSDLSHYMDAETAEPIDQATLQAVKDLEPEASEVNACGTDPILVADIMARREGWEATVLDYANTGDVTNDDTRVVGYGAVAYSVPGEEIGLDTVSLSDVQKSYLLDLARSSIERYLTDEGEIYEPVEPVDEQLKQESAVFVTLESDEELRGCMGSLSAEKPLYLAVRDKAIDAAVNDARFDTVTEEELSNIAIEISVLSEAKSVELDMIQPNVDGVILTKGENSATFLPSVWGQMDTFEDFMEALSVKAGLSSDDWQETDVEFSRYRTTSFSE